MSISQLECFRATVAHQHHEGFLFRAGFTPNLERRLREYLKLGEEGSIGGYFGMFAPVGVGLKPPEDQPTPDFSPYYEDIEIPENARITSAGVLHIPGGFYHFVRYVSPLRNATKFEDLESYPWPDNSRHSEEGMSEIVSKAHESGRVATCWVGHMYEDAWQIRGYEQFLTDMIERSEWCEFILDKLTERNLRSACAAARAGVDFITTGDDVANQKTLMFKLEHWRRFMKSRWAKVYESAKRIKSDLQIWYHSDGNITDIVPELIEIGVTILNPIQPECMNPLEIKEKYGDKVVLEGTIGTQSTMPFRTADEVRSIVRERARTLGYDGALILAPTHILEPEVPIQNVIAFVEACKEFGEVV